MDKKRNLKPSCFSTKIDLSLVEKLKKDLMAQGFSLSIPTYTLFQAKKKGISVTVYQSGALTVQGKGKEEFLEFYLEPKILKDLSYSYPAIHVDKTPHIGVDEAGKGDFFGPLCTAAVYADASQIDTLVQMGVKDSKRFSDSTILKLGKQIQQKVAYHLIVIYPPKYNELYAKIGNLNHLLAWCHLTAMEQLSLKTGCKHVLIDRFAEESLIEKAAKKRNLPLHITQKVRGEEDIVVAAASILARKSFLEGLEKLSSTYQTSLPKGASSSVVEAAKQFAFQWGLPKLEEIAKKHFKIYEEVARFCKYA